MITCHQYFLPALMTKSVHLPKQSLCFLQRQSVHLPRQSLCFLQRQSINNCTMDLSFPVMPNSLDCVAMSLQMGLERQPWDKEGTEASNQPWPRNSPHCVFPARAVNTLSLSSMLSHSVVTNSLRPHRLQPTRLLCPQDFPGKNAGVQVAITFPRFS